MPEKPSSTPGACAPDSQVTVDRPGESKGRFRSSTYKCPKCGRIHSFTEEELRHFNAICFACHLKGERVELVPVSVEVAGDGTVSVADQVENFVAKGKATERAIEQVFAEEVKTYAQKLYDHMRACTAKTCERGYLRWAKTSDVTHIQYVPRSMVCTVARRLLDTLKSAQRQLDGARMFGHRQTGGGS